MTKVIAAHICVTAVERESWAPDLQVPTFFCSYGTVSTHVGSTHIILDTCWECTYHTFQERGVCYSGEADMSCSQKNRVQMAVRSTASGCIYLSDAERKPKNYTEG